MKLLGIILIIIGAIASIITGMNVISESESFSLFGLDITVSQANWTPLIISIAVLVVGIILNSSAKKRSST